MADGIIRAGLEKLEQKYMPKPASNTVFVPQESYRSLFSMLGVWGRDEHEPEFQDKAKYIYETLKKDGDPEKALMTLLTMLGLPNQGDRRIDQVWNFLHLQDTADQAKRYYDMLSDQLNSMKKPEVIDGRGQ